MNDCNHFKSLVPIKDGSYICNTCGWIFQITHITDITVKELLRDNERIHYVTIPDDVMKELNLKPGDRLELTPTVDKVTKHRFVKVTKAKPNAIPDMLDEAIRNWLRMVSNESK